MGLYRVTYFYLATGMEGRADERDYGIVEAGNAESAKLQVARAQIVDPAARIWMMTCLSATPIEE